jgi:hypothetical protein
MIHDAVTIAFPEVARRSGRLEEASRFGGATVTIGGPHDR